MKKTDVATIIFIAAVSMLVAYFIGNAIFSGMTTQGEKVKTIESITSTVEQPSTGIFNKDAINPSIEVQITGSPEDTTQTTDTTSPIDNQTGTQ